MIARIFHMFGRGPRPRRPERLLKAEDSAMAVDAGIGNDSKTTENS